MNNLTLTSVVFEIRYYYSRQRKIFYLTLTSVVFENKPFVNIMFF